ncbi:MAG: antibiotic biosynthesis monooxygenase [Anaerolineales bacterium]|nr:antibiotic biosynthesis monooxygenase [Anaerolineales bacterium]
MIARLWHGVVPADKADAYNNYLHETGVPDLQNTPGNEGVYVLRRIEDDVAHYLMLSLWDSLDSIKAFAGDDIERARYYPKDTDFLLELEPTVRHYQVIVAPDGEEDSYAA